MFAHRLKANKSTSTPKRIIFIDTETSQRKLPDGDIAQDFRYGEGLYWRRNQSDRKDKLERFQIWDIDSFWDWLLSKTRKKGRLVVTSHNLNIDMVVLKAFTVLPERGYTIKSIYLAGMTKIIRFKGERGTILFLDNANWWKSKLEVLGELVGYKKLDVDPTNTTIEDLIPYCQRDTEIIYHTWKAWFKFLSKHNLGNWGITIGSQAFKAYTHRFMNHEIFIHSNKDVITLERQAYHGGRVEAFWLGSWSEQDMYKIDVNSMYPFVMKEKLYPTKLLNYRPEGNLLTLRRLLDNNLVTAEVTLDIDKPVFPLKGDKGIYYPIGKFSTVLSTPELRYANKRGWIKSAKRIASYTGSPIFSSYVDYFYDLKRHYQETGEKVYYQATKLMLNTLYGKFGQKRLEDTIIGECAPGLVRIEPFIEAKTGKKGRRIYIGGSIIETIEGDASYNTFVGIAAHVTAYARMYLWELINIVGRENTIYCDTDSMIVNLAGLENIRHLLDDYTLGMLKIEEIAQRGEINGRKDYKMMDKVTLKGIPKTAKKIDTVTWAFDMWPSIKSLLRKGNADQYYIHPTSRTLKRELTWGELQENGRITPYVIV